MSLCSKLHAALLLLTYAVHQTIPMSSCTTVNVEIWALCPVTHRGTSLTTQTTQHKQTILLGLLWSNLHGLPDCSMVLLNMCVLAVPALRLTYEHVNFQACRQLSSSLDVTWSPASRLSCHCFRQYKKSMLRDARCRWTCSL